MVGNVIICAIIGGLVLFGVLWLISRAIELEEEDTRRLLASIFADPAQLQMCNLHDGGDGISLKIKIADDPDWHDLQVSGIQAVRTYDRLKTIAPKAAYAILRNGNAVEDGCGVYGVPELS